MTKTVTAYEARTKLGELLNLVYYKGDTIIIKKMGKPMGKLISARKEKKDEIQKKKNPMRWGGIWHNKDAELIEKYAVELRMKGKVTAA